MAHVHVGFHDQRSCNRILKPPGGGTSNIFGTDRILEVDSPKKVENVRNVQESLQTQTARTEKSIIDENGTTHAESSTEVKSEQNTATTDMNGISHADGYADHLVSKEVVSSNPNDVVKENDAHEAAMKIIDMSIQESKQRECKGDDVEANNTSNTSLHYETKTVTTSSAEIKSSRTSTSSTIGDVLNQDGVAVKAVDVPKKDKSKTPHRVPPGGYSSGLW